MNSLPTIEVFLRSDPLEAVIISDPPIEVNQPIFQTVNPSGFATAEQGELAETALQPEAIADFETATQLNARDTANRDRANHSGTQAISTVSGLQNALDGKQPTGDYATNSALTLGLSGKANALHNHSIEDVLGLQNALDGKATTSQGAKADSALQPGANISSLNNDTGYLSAIPNPYFVNGVAHFIQATKPLTRPGGLPLVADDKWYNTTDNVDCFFQGVNWLGPQKEILRSGTTNLVNGVIHSLTGVPLIQEQSNNIFVKSLSAIIRLTSGGTYNGSNYWRVGPTFETNSALGLTQGTFPNPFTYHNITSYAQFVEVITPINTYLNDNLQLANLRLWTSSVGSPNAAQWVGGRFIYHQVY